MNSIDTNINNKYGCNRQQIRFKAEPQAVAQEVQLPDMYYMPDYANRPQSFKEKLKKYDVMGLITPWFEHPLMMLGTCLGISVGVDAFDRSCNKEYSESILGKAAKFGDKIENSTFVQNEKTQNVLGGIKKGWNGIKSLFNKNSVIKAMAETPSRPEYSMPLDEIQHTEYRVVCKFKELANKYNIMPKSKEEKEGIFSSIKKPFKQIFKSEEKDFREILKGLGKSEAEIETILKSAEPIDAIGTELKKALNLTDEQLKKIMQDKTGKTAKVVENACANVKEVKGFSEVYNRSHSLRSIVKNGGAETKTGRFMSRFLQKLHRGFTFGGSKYGVMLFVAPMLVETMLNTKKADKKEKVGTFTQGLIQSVSWVFVFPLVLKGIHAIGGAQYAGMGKEKVNKMRDLINDFNKRVDAHEFKTKADYDKALKGLDGKSGLYKQIKDLKHVENQSLLTKIIRKISAFTKADLEKIKPFNNGSKLGNFARKLPNFLKDAAYSPARFLVFMMVGMPLVDKVIEKCTSKIFGKPYDAMKEEEALEKKKAQEEYTMNDLRERMLEVQRRKVANVNQSANNQLTPETEAAMAEIAAAAATEQAAQQQEIKPQRPIQNTKPEEEQIQQVQQQTTQTQRVIQNTTVKRDNYTYIPSQENVLNTVKPQTQINKYIPSQVGAQFAKTFDNSGLDAALKRANNAERRALEALSGNFSRY